MSQWLLVVMLAACAAGFLVFPILRTRNSGKQPVPSLEIHKERLRKLDREVSSGETTAEVAKKERAEIEHDIAAIVCSNPVQAPISHRRKDLVAAGAIGAVVIAGAVGLYLAAGQSVNTVESQEFLAANGLAPTQPKLPDVDTMIARVAERLKTNPDNAEDWRMLGWSYFETQHYTEAADAYSHAVARQPETASLQSAFGEAQVFAAGGSVTPEAMKAFAAALKTAPDDERALHFSGVAKSQKGDPNGAVAIWIAALRNAKPDSLWAPRLRAEINETAKAASIDVSAQLPAAAPTSEEKFAEPAGRAVQQAQSMSPEEQQSMIKTMVAGLDERLARNPRDREGWVRLIRSRKVLGEPEQARAALDRALVAFKDDPTTQVELRTAALELGISSAGR